MPRLRRLVRGGKAFFITTNLCRGLPALSAPERALLCFELAAVRDRRKAKLAGFVIMPDHAHLLVLPSPQDTISRFVQEFKYTSGRRINTERQTKESLWQKGFFERFMRTPQEFLETLTYMHQNPLRKNLALAADEWQWSSASAYAESECIIPIDFIDLPAEAEKRLW